MTDDPRAWSRIEALLDAALDLDPADRPALLERECARDHALRARVEALIAAADTAGSFLEQPVHALAAGLIHEMASTEPALAGMPPPFERVGPYRLLGELGRGGMGAVYLAERDDDQFRRRVAVKLMQPAAAHDLTHRFLAERQILASLDHPNIARLYDGGTTDGGMPYLVMEYIGGRRLDVYCDENRLPVADRLALFDTVCAAVQFAHQNLVVHRDLKPGNVMVADDGTVKLLDFGVAKLLDPADSAGADLTRTGALPITPAYASPEQLRGEPVSTATDVYALGVLLYELLTGRPPYDVSGRTPAEVERVVSEQEPAAPSAAVGAGGAGVGLAAQQRRTTPDGLRRRLEGDLDTIVLVALRKEPGRRYASVHHLRDDLRRQRDGLPVSARAPTLTYRTAKFLRRHRVAVATGAVVLLSLLGGLAATTWQARVASREARRATEVRDFLVALFASADPDSTRGRTLTVAELLDRGAARLDSGLAAEPALRADMLGVVGTIYRELGLYGRARPLMEEALSVRRALGLTDIAGSAGDLAAVLHAQGEFEEAEPLAREALASRRGRADTPPSELAGSLADLATILSNRGETAAADSLYREALAIERRVGNRAGLATKLSDYGTALWRAARYEESQRALEEAHALLLEVYGEEHTRVATARLNLATTVMELGDYARAEQLLIECLDLRKKLLSEQHPHVAVTYNNLGDLYQRTGRLEDAENAHRQAHAIYLAALGGAHPDVANSLNHIGVILYFRGRYGDAAATFEQVLPVWRATYGPRHRNVFHALNNLGASLRAAGLLPRAEEVLRETLALRREEFGDEHPDVAQSLNQLALVLAQRGDDAEAETLMRQAIAMWRETLHDEHPTVADGLVGYGLFLLERSRFTEAEPILHEGLTIRAASLDPAAPLLASARLYYAECLIRLRRFAGADTLLAAALPVLRQQWGDDHDLTRRGLRALEQLASPR